MSIGSLFSGIGGLIRVTLELEGSMGGKGSGSKPKIYDPELVAEVDRLYTSGMTQLEVGASLGVSQKVVYNLMRRHGISTRARVKRDQRGEKNASWKGDSAGYSALHLRVAARRGKPSLCEHCGTTEAKRFEWANLTGNYADVNDYARLCGSCHRRMDGTIRNITSEK